MTTIFKITEHTIPCQHIREYPCATADSQSAPLYLSVKQYTPLSNSNPAPGDVTIIATTANAMPKETYEPLWEEMIKSSVDSGISIRNIWMADMSHQGASGVLNETHLGNDPHWFDHSRDLLSMMNHFRDLMPHPIVGIGHSLGAAQLVFLSSIHPRLFTSLILIEPWITDKSPPSGIHIAKASVGRRDVWPSRAAASASFQRSPVFKAWDPRALSRMQQHGLRSTPTLVHPDADANAVTLTTTKHQESFTLYRPNYSHVGLGSPPSLEQRTTHPDIVAASEPKSPFYNTWRHQAFFALPSTRPPVLYVYGSKSMLATPELRAELLRVTGTGSGGSGGAELRQVKEELIPGSHFVPMENVAAVAGAVSEWLKERMATYRANELRLSASRAEQSMRERQLLSQQYLRTLKAWDGKAVSKDFKL